MHDLLTSRPDYSLVFHGAPCALMLINVEGGAIVDANRAALTLLDCDSASVLGKTTIDIGMWAQPMDRSRLMHVFSEDRRLTKRAVRLLRRTGKEFDAELSIEAVNFSGATCFLVAIVDCSDQIHLTEELRSARDQLSVALRGTVAGAWHCNLETLEVEFSPSAWELLERTGAARGSGPFAAYVHAQDVPTLLASLDALKLENRVLDLPLRLICANGSFKWFRLQGQLSTAGSGNAAAGYARGTLEDIHASKVAELNRIRDNERAWLAITAANMGTWEMFEDYTSIWDPQTYRIYGYDPGTSRLPAEIYRDALSDEDYARCNRWLAKSLKHGLSLSIEFRVHWPDGQTRWLASRGHVSTNAASGARSLLGMNWDITDRRRSEHVLLDHRRQLSTLTVQLMQQEQQTTKKLAQVLHDQLGQTLTAARLMLDLQLQSHPSEAAIRMDGLMTQAMEQVRDLLVDLRPPMLEERGLGFALDNEVRRAQSLTQVCDLLFHVTDEAMERRWPSDIEYAFFMIAREAITNALVHSRAKLIQVRLEVAHEGLTVEVIDDGLGFPAAGMERRAGHLGLVGMQERAAAVSARLSVGSEPGDGSRVKLAWEPHK